MRGSNSDLEKIIEQNEKSMIDMLNCIKQKDSVIESYSTKDFNVQLMSRKFEKLEKFYKSALEMVQRKHEEGDLNSKL